MMVSPLDCATPRVYPSAIERASAIRMISNSSAARTFFRFASTAAKRVSSALQVMTDHMILAFRPGVNAALALRRLIVECRGDAHQLIVQLTHRLGDDADFAQHAHEIGVPVPARDDVLVDVPGQARAGAAAEIDADVEPLRRDGAAEKLHRANGLAV